MTPPLPLRALAALGAALAIPGACLLLLALLLAGARDKASEAFDGPSTPGDRRRFWLDGRSTSKGQ